MFEHSAQLVISRREFGARMARSAGVALALVSISLVIGMLGYRAREVVKARMAVSPRYPRAIHYRGEGIFMVSGRHLNLHSRFRPGML